MYINHLRIFTVFTFFTEINSLLACFMLFAAFPPTATHLMQSKRGAASLRHSFLCECI